MDKIQFKYIYKFIIGFLFFFLIINDPELDSFSFYQIAYISIYILVIILLFYLLEKSLNKLIHKSSSFFIRLLIRFILAFSYGIILYFLIKIFDLIFASYVKTIPITILYILIGSSFLAIFFDKNSVMR